MSNMVTIPLISIEGLRKVVEICIKNGINYHIKDCENPYKVLIPTRDYVIWGLDEMEFE